MTQADSSIAQLISLVETLRGLLERHPEDRPWSGESPRARPASLVALWPRAAAPAVEQLGQDLLDHLGQVRGQALEQLQARLRRRRELGERAVAQMERQAQAARLAQARAQADRERARLELEPLEAVWLAAQDRAERLLAEARKLNAWLSGVEPQGLNRFRDAQGRDFGRQVVEEYTRRLQDMGRSLAKDRQQAQSRLEALTPARRLLEQAQQALEKTRHQGEKLGLELEARGRQLEQAQAGLDALAAETDQARADLGRARALARLHAELLNLASRQLAPVLLPPEEVADPLPQARREVQAAAEQARRAARLADLARRQERRLAAWGPPAQEAQRLAREINRELKHLEDSLPGLLGPLTSRDTAQAPARALATAGLSTLLARLEELAPEARRTQRQLATLRQGLARALERGKACLDGWRQAGKAERAHLQQAQALLEEAGQAAQAQAQASQSLAAQAGQVVESLAGLELVDLWPSLAAVATQARALEERSLRMESQAAQLAEQVGPPQVGSLSKPPVVLKEHGALVRRLAGQRVELERLTAMLGAAKGWRTLLASPILAAARRHAEEVALSLSASLGKVAGERQRLLDSRQRVTTQLLSLRRQLGQERQTSGRLGVDLADSRSLALELAGQVERLESGLGQALGQLEEERDASRRQIHVLRSELSGQRRAGEELRGALTNSLGRVAGLQERVDSLESQLTQARAELEEQRRQSGQSLAALGGELDSQRQEALELRRDLAQGREQAASREARVASLEQSLAQAREELARERQAAEERLAAMGRDLGRERQSGQEARQSLERTRQRLAHRQAAALEVARRLRETRRRAAGLGRELTAERLAAGLAKRYLAKTQARNLRQKRQIALMDDQLALARQGQAAAGRLMAQLEAAGLDIEELSARLAHSQRLAAALRDKSLERHRLLRQAQAALAPLPYWQHQAQTLEEESSRLRAELRQARQELAQANRQLKAAASQRDQAQTALAGEQAARARQALDLLQGQTMSVELTATQVEASRWAALAQDLAQALALAGHAHQQEVSELRLQAEEMAAKAVALQSQLDRLSLMMALYSHPETGQGPPVRVRLAALTPAQMDRMLDRLASVRGRLKELGRSTIGHWALVAALTAGLVLVAPNTPSTATSQVSPLLPPRQEVRQLRQGLNFGPNYEMNARASLHLDRPAQAELEMNLVPLRKRGDELPPGVREQVGSLARRSGLSPQVLMTSARAAFGDRDMVEPQALAGLADLAQGLANRHPLIFRELAQKGLPKEAQDLARLAPAPERAQHLFLDRLYREYRALGFSPEEALGALTANERAVQGLRESWRSPGMFTGQARPLAVLETLTLPEFLARITPYIQTRLEYYLRGGGVTFTGDVGQYAKNLAFDIYCAAKKFDVPVSLMLVIAHQETTFANVLGDSNRSASPFQIFEPTRRLIVNAMERDHFVPPPQGLHLERHLTMATYMAAFHMRELMQESYLPPQNGHPGQVDLDKVLKRYNGSAAYIGAVAARHRQLSSFLRGEEG